MTNYMTNLLNKIGISILKFWNFKPLSIRFIETIGCMAADGPMEKGIVIDRVVHNVYNGSFPGKPIPFLVVKMDSDVVKEVPEQDCFRAKDGVLEYRF